jgi:energy-coupling factor transporter transmembrane protein EcfT
LRRSIDASLVWSSMRVAPRSVISVTAVSAMISTGDAAVLATGQVQLMSPTVRKRTDSTSLTRRPASA